MHPLPTRCRPAPWTAPYRLLYLFWSRVLKTWSGRGWQGGSLVPFWGFRAPWYLPGGTPGLLGPPWLSVAASAVSGVSGREGS